MSPRAQGDQTDGVLSEAAQRAVSLALQQSPVAIMLTDVDGRIHYANPRFYQLTGYQPADLERVNVFDLSARAEEEFLMWTVISSGKAWRGELPGVRRNGERFWASAFVAPVRGDDGELSYFLGVFDEIDEPRLEFPTNIAPDIILIVDRNGKILYTNRSVPGIPREQAMGDTLFSYVPSNFHDRLRGHIELAIHTRRPVTYEIPSAGPHGTTDYYVSQLAPIERDGEVIALSIATIDLSRRSIPARARQRSSTERPARLQAPELSKREAQVLELLVQGLTNRQVAQRLRVSLRTIDHHVSHILKKLAVPNRTAAVLVARRSGLL
jgi:PAS domain S-box-containing protein